jgi:hypothetical protein
MMRSDAARRSEVGRATYRGPPPDVDDHAVSSVRSFRLALRGEFTDALMVRDYEFAGWEEIRAGGSVPGP